MRIEFERFTLSREIVFSGVGIHSGEKSSAKVLPGSDGIVFRYQSDEWKADPSNVSETVRSTTIGQVRMVEHLMSAFAGIGVTDATIVCDAQEMPILDGSAKEYFDGIRDAGLEPLRKKRQCRLFGRVNLNRGEQRLGISLGTGRWRYEFEREGHWPGYQSCEVYLEGDAYETRVAPARTFVFEDELETVREMGLGKGGDATNTLVIGSEGYLTESRFPDEAPRHKLLDLIGDLYLSGIPPRFLNVVAERTGHRMHVEGAARLVEICKWEDQE